MMVDETLEESRDVGELIVEELVLFMRVVVSIFLDC